jgi:penicillin-binding protein 2
MIPASRRRLAVLYVVVASLLFVLGFRVWDVQIASGKTYAELADQDRVQRVVEPAVRGEILDDEGQPMVDNRSELVVSVDMNTLEQQGGGGTELHQLASLLGMSYTLLSEKVRLCTKTVHQPCWQGSPYQPIPVAQNVPDKVALQVLESPQEYPGVTASVQPVANYVQPISTDTAQVLGYLQPVTAQEVKSEHLPETGFSGVDLAGQSGLEEQYDSYLRGTPGIKTVSINAAGQVTGTVKQTPAIAGDDLVTSINAKVQEDTENALAEAVQKAQAEGNVKATSGAAVVLTTKGRVVAMASYPTYDPSVWTGGLSEREFRAIFGARDGVPILNRATQGEYAPGSTWKVTTLAAAIKTGVTTLSEPWDCPATVSVGGSSYANDGEPSLGDMSLAQALVVSCDTVFYELGLQMWERDHPNEDVVTSAHAKIQPEQKMELDWGFGKDTGIDLPEGSAGSVPTREWLYYFWKDNAHTGQDWCKNGNDNGDYDQQIEWFDCRYANDWLPGQAVISSIGDGYVTVTPLQLADAYDALANGGTLYSPRIGEELISPSGKVVKKITPPVIRHLPVSGSVLSYIRTALQGVVTSGTAAATFAGFPLNKVCVAGKTGTAEAYGNQPTSVFASFAPCSHPKYVVVMMIPDAGYGADVSGPAVRQIWEGIYGLQGHSAALVGGELPRRPHMDAQGQVVETSAPARKEGRK